eukprot:TRINITY_DN11767_c0_g1_i1.p1 TRINITY_DN11767_c0_g1~~TRINITY_DN11767_c0_g1_i1.p1  ORF type:complete len:569 (+),score=166.17 TRINITY_DN11767_c0_g1_i1:53-1708(+)
MSAPVLVLNANTKRETGAKAQQNNILAAKSVSDITRTTLGPKAMLKMILDPMGGIVMTNDGNAILREIDVTHPAAKSMIELARTQDEEVGDGTTSVIILAGEILSVAQPFLDRKMHPRTIVSAYILGLEDILACCNKISKQVDVTKREEMLAVVKATIGTKFASKFADQIANMALDAVSTVTLENENKKKDIDIKRYAKVEKLPGGMIEESKVLNGLMFEKDVVHPQMRRKIVNPRILLLDCGLEYKKGESQTTIEVTKDEDYAKVLKIEEQTIEKMCKEIIKFKPTLVFTEKGVSDLAQHYLIKANISVIRRLRKTDNNRIARAVGATICHETSEIAEKDIGVGCGLYEVRKIGDEYFTYLVNCKAPKSCTIVLRGGSKDVLNELERNLQDAMYVARNLMLDNRVLPGGGACEMACSRYLKDKAKSMEGAIQYPYRALASALEVIPRTLIENCGASTIRLMTQLRAEHAEDKKTHIGIDGVKGAIADMNDIKIWDTLLVKTQTYKTAIEAACMLLRIDDIVSGMSSNKKQGSQAANVEEQEETFGDNRDG